MNKEVEIERHSEEAASMKDNKSPEERDILDLFERDELSSAAGADREIGQAFRVARHARISTESLGADILALRGVSGETDTGGPGPKAR